MSVVFCRAVAVALLGMAAAWSPIAEVEGVKQAPLIIVSGSAVLVDEVSPRKGEKTCDGLPIGRLRFKDGRMQLCRE